MKCRYCNQNAVYRRRYSGEKLCRGCFVQSINRLTRHTISRYNMFSPLDHIALGLSGGKDSTVLLHVLHAIEKDFPRAQLSAIVIDEGIQQYRSEAIQLAKTNCQHLNIPLHHFSFNKIFGITLDQIADMQQAHRPISICSLCGILRRKALNIAAKQIHASKLVVAHNLDDEVQSMLLCILRGDLQSLSSIHPILDEVPGFVQKVKPFCEILEREIALYAHLKGLTFQTIPCPYLTSSMRNNVREFLNHLEHHHSGIKYTIYRSFSRLIPAQLKKTRDLLTRCQVCGEPAASKTCRACALLHDFNK